MFLKVLKASGSNEAITKSGIFFCQKVLLGHLTPHKIAFVLLKKGQDSR